MLTIILCSRLWNTIVLSLDKKVFIRIPERECNVIKLLMINSHTNKTFDDHKKMRDIESYTDDYFLLLICWISFGKIIRTWANTALDNLSLSFSLCFRSNKKRHHLTLICFTQQAVKQTSLVLCMSRTGDQFLHLVNIDWHLCSYSICLFFSSDKSQQRCIYGYLSLMS